MLSSNSSRALVVEKNIPVKDIQQKSKRYSIPKENRFQLNPNGEVKVSSVSGKLLGSPSLTSLFTSYSKIQYDINQYYKYLLTGKYQIQNAVQSNVRHSPKIRNASSTIFDVKSSSAPFASKNEFEKKIISKEFILKSTVFQAIVDQGERLPLVQRYVDLFSWDINFYLDPKKGDKIRIQFEKYFKHGKFFKYGKILAAQYIGKEKYQSAFLYGKGSKEEYYNEEGSPLRKKFLKLPVKFGYKTSSYSIRRFHPISKKYKRHTGIDYGAAIGSPVLSTAQGLVKFSGWKSGYGKLVIIQHAKEYETYYGHNSKLLVEPGQWVTQGEIIAKVGQSGLATGPHVHYEVRIKNIPINPATLINGQENRIEPDQFPNFQNIVQARLSSLNSPYTAKQEDSTLMLSKHIKPAAVFIVKAFFF